MAEAIMKPLVVKTLTGILLISTLVLGFLRTPAQAQSFASALREAINQSWYELSPQERSRALENYRRFQKLPPEKQRSIEERYNRWQQLPSDEQERIRRNYDRYRGMNSDQKEEFSRKYKQWRSLPR
ncbi:MAG TPA: DUF3106 domain-containing protein [Candidatus Binatia bacterium]|jgi:hypothetical protein|nr:DUF3106 domain-containing protein [Candidatus Binatia bacterium]